MPPQSSLGRYALLAILAILLGMVGALWLSVQSINHRLMTVKSGVLPRLVITDDQGHPRIVLDGSGEASSLSLLDSQGQTRLEASIDASGTASVFLLDPKNEPRLGAISLANGEVIQYRDRVDLGEPEPVSDPPPNQSDAP